MRSPLRGSEKSTTKRPASSSSRAEKKLIFYAFLVRHKAAKHGKIELATKWRDMKWPKSVCNGKRRDTREELRETPKSRSGRVNNFLIKISQSKTKRKIVCLAFLPSSCSCCAKRLAKEEGDRGMKCNKGDQIADDWDLRRVYCICRCDAICAISFVISCELRRRISAGGDWS